MGYLTDFNLTIVGGCVDKDDLAKTLTDITNYSWSSDLELHGAKWYDFHRNMINISEKYPDIVFCLDGVGEESGDIWRAYYQDGKFQMCKATIVFDQFDKDKMK